MHTDLVLVIYVFCAIGNMQIRYSSSSVGATARCWLWPVEQYLSICPYLSPTRQMRYIPTYCKGVYQSKSTKVIQTCFG
jgi:hypothetical protein